MPFLTNYNIIRRRAKDRMNEKKKCPNCGLLIDSDIEKCPYCGVLISECENKPNVVESEVIEEKKTKKATFPHGIFTFSRVEEVSSLKRISLFLSVILGLTIITSIFYFFSSKFNPYFLTSITGNAMLNFSAYLIIFGCCLLIINKDYKNVFSKYGKSRTYLYGIGYGFLLLLISATYSAFVRTIFPGVGENNNENSINKIIAAYPIFSLIVFAFIGPMCEEFAYRLGLFGFVRKYKRIAAYIITALIFGFIHFDFSGDLKVEFLNLPSYVLSGLLLCYVYDKEGIETSTVTHITNNLIAIIFTIYSVFFL